MLLSDVSQGAETGTVYPPDLEDVSLKEVVRSSQPVVLAAMAFQVINDKHQINDTAAIHKMSGPPLRTVLFKGQDEAYSEKWFSRYVEHIVSALEREVIKKYENLSLHCRLAIIVPNEKFRASLVDPLDQAIRGKNFQLINSERASRMIPKRNVIEDGSPECLVLDTVDNLDGLEMLMVFVVGFDDVPDIAAKDVDAMTCRSGVYRAITRAIMYVVVINELLPGGMLEWLGLITYSEGQELDPAKERAGINPLAGRNVARRAKKAKEASKLNAEKRGHSGSLTKGNIKAENEEVPQLTKKKSLLITDDVKISNNVWDTRANTAQVLAPLTYACHKNINVCRSCFHTKWFIYVI